MYFRGSIGAPVDWSESPRRTRVPKAGLSEARISRGRTERVCADGTRVDARGGSAATAEDSRGSGTRGGVLVHQTGDRETLTGTETIPNNRPYDTLSRDCSSARPSENRTGRWQCATNNRGRWRGRRVRSQRSGRGRINDLSGPGNLRRAL